MNRSELFLLFPVFDDIKNRPHYISSIGIISEESLKNYADDINKIMDFIENENYKGFYDSKNVYDFLYPVYILNEYYPNAITRFRSIMSKWGEDWRQTKQQNSTENYMFYCFQINDDTLCEIVKRKAIVTEDKTFLIINCNAINCKEKYIRIIYNGKIIEIDVSKPNIKEVAKWFQFNRKPKRCFNWNPKHGEYGKGSHPSNNGDKVSVLLGSRGEAALLLHKAIGENLNKIFYYDIKYKKFIEFKRENENVYHGFHLDKEDEIRIPKVIKERISIIEEVIID